MYEVQFIQQKLRIKQYKNEIIRRNSRGIFITSIFIVSESQSSLNHKLEKESFSLYQTVFSQFHHR